MGSNSPRHVDKTDTELGAIVVSGSLLSAGSAASAIKGRDLFYKSPRVYSRLGRALACLRALAAGVGTAVCAAELANRRRHPSSSSGF